MDSVALNVSRETLEDLTRFHDLVLKWTVKINLISKSSASDLWSRHIWDSAQLVEFFPLAKSWLDIGSGGGFPGIVLAILAKHQMPERQITMVESDLRKCAFLRSVVRELSLNAKVLSRRIQAIPPQSADIMSARALSDLPALLAFAERHLAPGGTALFLKGETWEKEVQTARESWSFALQAHKSKTNPAAAILEVKDIKRV